MRALMIAVLLALATAVPAFAEDDGGSAFRPPVTTVDVGGPQTWTP
jgi:hypothetical protein